MALTDSVLAAVVDADASDQAAADLAITYAQAIDDGGDLARLGPALLQTLEALHMTPRARARIPAAPGPTPTPAASDEEASPDDGPAPSALAQLRERRRARLNGAATVDTAPS